MSKWAGQFERDHGLVVTEGRLENANKRAQGEQVDAKRKPRNVYEQELTETTDRRDDFKKRQQADKARDLTAENRQMHEQHDVEWASLKASYRAEKDAIFQDHKQHSKLQIDEMKDANTRKWQALFMRQRSEKQDFDRSEKTAIGRIGMPRPSCAIVPSMVIYWAGSLRRFPPTNAPRSSKESTTLRPRNLPRRSARDLRSALRISTKSWREKTRRPAIVSWPLATS